MRYANPSNVLRVDYAGGFRAVLATNGGTADDMATVYLERECIDGTHTRIGSVDLQANETWQAAIASNPTAFKVVGRGMHRMAAITALWHHRSEAFVGYCGLGS